MKKFKILKVVGLFLLLALALLLLVRCEKVPPVVPPVVVPVKYTVEAFAVNGIFTPSELKVSEGSKSGPLNLKANNGFDPDSVFINGMINESFKGKTTFSFSNVDGDINIKAVCKINPWGILMNGPWETVRWQRRFVNDTNWEMDLTPPVIRVLTMTFDSYREKAVDSKGVVIEDYEYQFLGDTLARKNGMTFRIVELTEKVLILESLAPFMPSPGVFDPSRDRIVRETFIRK